MRARRSALRLAPARGCLLALMLALCCSAIDVAAQIGRGRGGGGGGGKEFQNLMDQGREAFRIRDLALAEDAVRTASSASARSRMRKASRP